MNSRDTMNKKVIRETNRYIHQKCPKCGHEWDDHEMIFESDSSVIKILHRKEGVSDD